ncbi:MAG: phosphate regulon transcriptional regulator PhoB [Pseudomonadota bacterium]
MEEKAEQPFRILVVEDEPGIQELIRVSLVRQGYVVQCADSVETADPILKSWQPQLLILDWMLPGESGLAWCRTLRRDEDSEHLPIMLITARGEESDRVRGLESGADDYISKPFSPKEMVARVKAVLRRAYKGQDQRTLNLGILRLELQSHRVFAGSVELHLGPTEFKLLRFLMSHPERVFTRNALLDRVWGQQVYVEERTVDVHIRRLRKALEPFGCENYIETVRGSGYRFRAETPLLSSAP